jgi:hypothetical protein
MSIASMHRFGFSYLGQVEHSLVASRPPFFATYDEESDGWVKQEINPLTLEDFGPSRTLTAEQAKHAVLGSLCDPLWFSCNLLRGIRLKWRGKPPLKWYRQVSRA